MLGMKRREFIALVGSGGLLAATNKYLAPSNKSRTGGKATQERERLKCSVGSNARDDRGLAVARHAVGPFPSQCHSAKGRIIVCDRGVRLDSEQFRSAPRTCRPVSGSLLPATDCLEPSAGGVVISCRAARPIINMRQRDFIALIGGAAAWPLATLVQELSTDRQEMP
jgi:hypothetical protein